VEQPEKPAVESPAPTGKTEKAKKEKKVKGGTEKPETPVQNGVIEKSESATNLTTQNGVAGTPPPKAEDAKRGKSKDRAAKSKNKRRNIESAFRGQIAQTHSVQWSAILVGGQEANGFPKIWFGLSENRRTANGKMISVKNAPGLCVGFSEKKITASGHSTKSDVVLIASLSFRFKQEMNK